MIGTAGILLFLAFWVYPRPASAGFLSEIFKLFGGSNINSIKNSLIFESEASSNDNSSLSAVQNPDASGDRKATDFNVVQESALMAPANPIGTIQDKPDQDQVFVYTVKPGDTVSSIAKSFSVSVNTILLANNVPKAGTLKVGDQIVILPVTGVKYVVKKGDTVDSIAKKLKGDATEILTFNGLAPGAPLLVGSEVIVPNGEANIGSEAKPSASQAQRFASLPNLVGYFLRPIQGGGRTQGIHGNNGVDLADSCGDPISAEKHRRAGAHRRVS